MLGHDHAGSMEAVRGETLGDHLVGNLGCTFIALLLASPRVPGHLPRGMGWVVDTWGFTPVLPYTHTHMRAEMYYQHDTLICYLLNELFYYEEGHGDALHHIQFGADISFMGKHLETRPATLGQVKVLCASVECTIHDQLNHQPSQPSGINHCGEHQPRAMTSLHLQLLAPTPTSLPQPPPSLSPPPSLRIPWTQANVPIHKHWLVFVKDWEEGDKEHGLTMPLKDWDPAWKATPPFAMNYHARKIVALEFIERYESITLWTNAHLTISISSCGRSKAKFTTKWPEATQGTTKLCHAIQKAYIREGKTKRRRSKNERSSGEQDIEIEGGRAQKRRKLYNTCPSQIHQA